MIFASRVSFPVTISSAVVGGLPDLLRGGDISFLELEKTTKTKKDTTAGHKPLGRLLPYPSATKSLVGSSTEVKNHGALL